MKSKIPFVSSDEKKSLEEIDDEIVTRAAETLDDQGEELNKEALRKQSNYFLELKKNGDGSYKVGFVQDREEAEVSDQSLIAPEKLKENHSFREMGYMERNDKVVRILTITDYPKYLPPGVLSDLYTTHANVRVTQHITPRDVQSVLRKLQRKLNRLWAHIARKREKGKQDTQEEQEQRDTVRRLIWDIITGKTKLFDFSIFIEIVADDKRELNNITKNIINVLSGAHIKASPIEKLQIESQAAVCPAARDTLKGSRQLMQETSLATMFPFIEPEIANPEGLIYGKDDGGKPIFFDPYDLSGYVEIITGKQGSGKTFAKMWEILIRYYKNPEYPTWVLDPKSNFTALAQEIGGQVIYLGGETKINPLNISDQTVVKTEDPYQDKCRSVMGMYRTHIGEDMDTQLEATLYRIMHLAYLKYGITPNEETHYKTPPLIQDHMEIAREIANRNPPLEFIKLEPGGMENQDEVWEHIAQIQDRMSPGDADRARFIYNSLESFSAGGVNSNLNGRTNVNLDNPFVVFDMGMFADTQQAPLMMHVLLDLIYQRCSRTKQKDEVIVDEVHKLFGNKEALSFINVFCRHHRHSNTRISLISQTADEFLVEKSDDNLRTEIYETADIKRIFYHKKVSDTVRDFHNLTDPEENYITNAVQGENGDRSQCLMEITGYGKIPVTIEVSEYDRHVVDEDLSVWDYIYEENVVSPQDLKTLSEQGRLDELNVPDSVLQKAGLPPGQRTAEGD